MFRDRIFSNLLFVYFCFNFLVLCFSPPLKAQELSKDSVYGFYSSDLKAIRDEISGQNISGLEASFKDACNSNRDGKACLKLGFLYYGVGIASKPDYEKAKTYYEKACVLNIPEGCIESALLFISPVDSFEKNYRPMKELFEKACNLNDGVGCHNLGKFYLGGLGVKSDYSMARDVFLKSCHLNIASGCYELGRMNEHGQGGDKNFFKANEFYTKGCDMKDGSSCYQLASLFCVGKGVRQDYLKAVEYYGKSCDYGNDYGCTLYANRNNLNCAR